MWTGKTEFQQDFLVLQVQVWEWQWVSRLGQVGSIRKCLCIFWKLDVVSGVWTSPKTEWWINYCMKKFFNAGLLRTNDAALHFIYWFLALKVQIIALFYSWYNGDSVKLCYFPQIARFLNHTAQSGDWLEIWWSFCFILRLCFSITSWIANNSYSFPHVH